MEFDQIFKMQQLEKQLFFYSKFSLILIALLKAKEYSRACSLYSSVTGRHGQALWVNVISQLDASSTHLHSLLA